MNAVLKPGSLFLLATALSFSATAQTSLVNHGDVWRYRKGTNQPPMGVWQTTADANLDTTWLTGNGGIGYAGNANETQLCPTLLTDMINNYRTLYMRRSFNIAGAVNPNAHLQLTMDFDDGFIAWLDGNYLTNRFITGAPAEPAFNALANTSHESFHGDSSPQPAETYDFGPVGSRLGVGTHVLAIIGMNNTLSSSDLIMVPDLSLVTNAANCISGAIAANTTWYASNSPIVVCGNLTINSGVTLTIEPGVTVQLGAGIGINVNGRLLAEGDETTRIHFTRQPAGGNWRSLDFLNTTVESRLAYVDFDSCAGATVGGHNAQLHVNGGSIIFIDHCTWPPTPVVEYISFDGSSFIVQNCFFPSYPPPTGPESLHGVNGIPAGGHGIFRDNYFGHTWGFNDTIDFTGGNRPGPILQFINNIFDGASDDCLDLDSTDAWIEGNIFMHVHRDPTRTDQAIDTGSAISGGVDFVGQNSDWTIINNLFYDVDHVILNKGNSTTTGNGGGRIAFLYNTVIHVAKEYSGSTAAEIAAFDWSDDNIALPDLAIGSGMYAAYNIIHDCPALHRFYDPAHQTVIMESNILSSAWTGPGSGNQVTDPMLNLSVLDGTAPTNVTFTQLRQAAQLLPGSPAIGVGFGGLNLGGLQPHGIVIAGEPSGITTNTSATLAVGLAGTFNWGTTAAQPWGWTAFKWKLDNGPWSAEVPVLNNSPFTNPARITLAGLSNGQHTVYVVGRNDAGYYQDDPFVYPVTAGIPASVTASRTWTVQSVASPKIEGVARDGDTVTFTFIAQAGVTYSVLYRDAIDDAHPWTKLADIPSQAVTGLFTFTDTSATPSHRFYQLVSPAWP